MNLLSKLVLFSGIILLAFSGCDSEDTGSLEINFKLKYDGETLVMFDEHEYPAGFDLFFSRFSFYMSEISAMGNANYQISEIEFINPTSSHEDLNSAMDGYSMTFKDVPTGDYNGLDFGIGVPSALNAMTPSDFSTDHPLGKSAEYWVGWASYVFIKVEGRIDFDGDGEYEEGMSLHVGSNAAYRNISMPKSFNISADATTIVEIEIDLMDVFLQNGALYDLEGTFRIHSLEQINQAEQLATNLAKAIEE